MISDLVNLINENEELELEGYCEYIANYNYITNSFENLPKKIYIYYINANNGKFEFVFSKDYEIFEVRDTAKYEDPDRIITEYTEGMKISDRRYFILNNIDYIERKLIEKVENKNKLIFLLYDFVITVNLSKRVNNIELFVKNERIVRNCKKNEFLDKVVYSKRTIAKPGSLEEKIYHLEDISNQEKELLNKNKKKDSGGFTAAMKSR